jgi:ABC-type nitrate/sulfonate/bicarbonate transport system permease component
MKLMLGGRLEPRAPQPLDARLVARRVVPPIVFGVIVLALWQLYVASSGVREQIVPSPLEVARALARDRAVLASGAGTTIEEILIGYGVAIVVGVTLALAISSSRLVERAVYPWLVITQLIPIPAIAVIVVLWAGFDIVPHVIVIALVSFFPIAVNTIDGLRSTDADLLDLLATLGAGRWRRMRLAQVPSALPFLFSGLRVAAALAVIGAVIAEWVGASSGLGYLILSYENQTATPDVFAVVVVLAVIGVVLFSAVGLFERVALPWYRVAGEQDARSR